MIQIFKGKKGSFYRKRLGLLSSLSCSVELYDCNLHYPWYKPKMVVPRVMKVKINSNRYCISTGLNRQNSTPTLPKVWINYVTVPLPLPPVCCATSPPSTLTSGRVTLASALGYGSGGTVGTKVICMLPLPPTVGRGIPLPTVGGTIAAGGGDSSRRKRRGEGVMLYPPAAATLKGSILSVAKANTGQGLKLGAEFILPRNFAKYTRSGYAITSLTRAISHAMLPEVGLPHSEGGSEASNHKLLGLLDSSSYPLNGKTEGNLLDKIYNKFAISCKESRIETNTSFYGCFYLGPFEQGESVTIANALRRTLLSDLMGVAITSVEIEGAMHEYASITGVRESVLDILLNLKEIILKQTTFSSSITFTPQGSAALPLPPLPEVAKHTGGTIAEPCLDEGSQETLPFLKYATEIGLAEPATLTSYSLTTPPPTKLNQKEVALSKSKVNYLERKKKGWGNQVGYLRARGPGVIKASDLKLPPYIVCVDPEQYIATLSDDGVLNMKFFISEGKNYLIQIPNKNLGLSEIKRRHLLQQKMKQGTDHERISKSFVRYAPFEITSDLPPVADLKNSVRVKSFFNLSKQKTVFNDASNGNRLPIDAVFMPVTKVNYIIEPDEQSNDEQSNNEQSNDELLNEEQSNGDPFNDSKRDFTYVSKAFPAHAMHDVPCSEANSSLAKPKNKDNHNTLFVAPQVSAESMSGGRPSWPVGGVEKSSLPLRFLPLTSEQVIADFQNLGLKKRSEEEQRAFSTLLVNPILKTQPPSLFFKYPFNTEIKMRRKVALQELPETRNPKEPSYSKEQSQWVDTSVPPSLSTTPEGLKKGNLRQGKKGSSDMSFTFLHPAPFLSSQHKNRINETLNASCEAQSQEEGQQIIFKNKKQQELLVFGKSQNRTFSSRMQNTYGSGCGAKGQIVGQEVFTKKNPLKFKIILEIWTNGSIHPRKALYDSFKSMITLFSRLQKVRILGSMLKSERFYNKLIEKKFKTKNVPSARQSPLASKKKLTSLPVASALPGDKSLTPGAERGKSGPSANDPTFEVKKQLLASLDDAKNKNPLPLSQQSSLLNPYKVPLSQESALVIRDDSLLLSNSSASETNSFTKGSECPANNKDPLLNPLLGTLGVGGGQIIKPKGLYSLNKTITGLQTYRQREWSSCNSGESAGDKLPARGQLDSIAIESLDLSLRSYTCLKRSNINTINDLMGYSKKQLIQIKNFGIHSLEEIQTRLGVFGFKLKP